MADDTKKYRGSLFSQQIVRFLAYFMVLLVAFSTVRIIVEQVLVKKINTFDARIHRQMAKRKIGSLINEKIILLELYFRKIRDSRNKYLSQTLFAGGRQEIGEIKKLLQVLRDGGTYTYTIVVNLNTADEVLEKITYDKLSPETGSAVPAVSSQSSGPIVIELIDILPKLEELESLMSRIHFIQLQLLTLQSGRKAIPLMSGEEQADILRKKLHISGLQADTLLLRARESSNRIFVDTAREQDVSSREHGALMEQLNTFRRFFYVAFPVVLVGMFALIFVKIIRILKGAREAEAEKQQLMARLQDANAGLEAIVANLPVGIVMVSSNKKIIQANGEAERILGYAPGEAEKLLYGKVCHDRYCTLGHDSCPIFDLKQPNVVLKERTAIKRDGSEVSILKSVIPIRLKGRQVLLEAFMDLSAIKRAEVAMKAAKEAAESANQAKSDFLANMSHEIRTPMNAIIGFSEILLTSETQPTRLKQLKMIVESAHSLLDLINDILDFSKIEAGKIQIKNQAFSIKALLRQVSSIFYVNVQDKGLGFKMSIDEQMPEFVVADELRLRQILTNLVGNAVKFTDNGEIRIHADYQAPDFVIRIEDTGVGIPEHRVRKIFEKFEQADSSIERKFGGTGLGLAICLSLIRLMDGDLDVKSREGHGTTFIVRLPFKLADNPGIKTARKKDRIRLVPATDPLATENIACLVVEDNPVNTKLLETHLKGMGIKCDAAEHGRIALEKMEKKTYDLVFMHMPVMNGMETLKAMTEKGYLPKSTVIALTADAIKGHDQGYLDAGCSAYISKPYKLDHLKKTLHRLRPDLFAEELAGIGDEKSLNEMPPGGFR